MVRQVLRSAVTEFNDARDEQPLPQIGPWQKSLDALLAANESKAARDRADADPDFRGAARAR